MRTKKALYNSGFSIMQKICEMALSFLFRTVLIYTLGKEYLGLTGLFTNIFSLLSLMELGIGSAIVFLMYEPINKKDYNTLNAYLKIYGKFYGVVGLIVLLIGIVLIPFLPNLINDFEEITINLIPIYVLTLLNVVCSYFLAHRRSLLEADQKIYINSINYSLYNILGTCLRIVALILFKNYNLTLVITLIITILSNIRIYLITNKMYPFLRDRNSFKLAKEKIYEIYRRMYAASIHQIGNVVVTSTDNLIISSFISLSAVGIYSNYSMLSSMIYSMFSLIFVSITSIVGNMKLSENNDKSKEIFNKLFFLNFYLYFIACTIFAGFINDFILIWIGKNYLLDTSTVILTSISLYIMGMRNNVVTFINSSGLSYQTRYKAFFEVIINIFLSIYMVKTIGLNGVIIGTIASYVLVSVWFEPYILFKYWLKDGLSIYIKKYIFCFFSTVFFMFAFIYINNFVVYRTFFSLIIKVLVCLVVLNVFIYWCFKKNEDYNYYLNYLAKIKKKIIKRRSRHE